MKSQPSHPQPSGAQPSGAGKPSLRRHVRAFLACPGVFAVLLPTLFLAATQALAWVWPPARVAAVHPAARLTGLVVLLAGLALFVWTNMLFHRGNGTLHPKDGPTTLVTTGPYGWSRNPMITAIFLILGGVAILLGSWTLAGYLLLFVIAKNIYIAKHEEPALRQAFGDLYTRYVEQVPRRWLPWPPREQRLV